MDDNRTPEQRRLGEIWTRDKSIPLTQEETDLLRAYNEETRRLCLEWEKEADQLTNTQLDRDCSMNIRLTRHLKTTYPGVGHAIYGRTEPATPEWMERLLEVVGKGKRDSRKGSRTQSEGAGKQDRSDGGDPRSMKQDSLCCIGPERPFACSGEYGRRVRSIGISRRRFCTGPLQDCGLAGQMF